MKILRKIQPLILLFGMIAFSSCDKDFQEINTSPDLVQKPSPGFTLPYIELTLLDGAYYTNFTYLGQFMSHVSGYGQQFDPLIRPDGGNYHFNFTYNNSIKNIGDFLDKTQGEEMVNYQSIGRILRAYSFHTITDLHGDVPYFEAGKGYTEKKFNPVYDEQKAIYADMLNELQDAANKFNPKKQIPANDIIYKGDISKWKKFAYSLILRLGLRMSKADPVSAKKWINIAVQGGVMESNADNCTVIYKPNTYYATISNGQPTPFIYYPTWKLAEPFVAFLRNNKDPRINVYSALPNKDTTSSKQIGLPPFTPSNEIKMPLTSYSVSPPSTFGKYDAPFIHLSYSQVQLMLAESAIRQWIPGDAKIFYENGVRAAMKEVEIYGELGKISDQQINDYLKRNPYLPASTEEALNLINTQYWLETHYNWYETFANWRRSGYPKLDETRFKLPRRLTYPSSEVNINSKNVQAAIERQGPDIVTTRVWWDK